MAEVGSASGEEPPPGSAAPAAPADPHPPSASVRVAKNSFWLIAQPLLMNAISLFQVAFVARRLGTVNYGRFVFAISFTAMFTPLTNLGLRLLTVRHIATADRKDLSEYVGKMVTFRFLLALVGAGLSAVIIFFVHQSHEAKQIVHLASAIIVFQALTTTITDVFQGFEKMRLDAQVRFTSGMVVTVLSVVALFLGFGLVGVMATYVFGNLVGTAMGLYYLFTRFTVPKLRLDLRFCKENLIKAVPFFFPTLVQQAGTRLGIVILVAMAGEAAVGTYGAASTLMDKLGIIPDGVCSALFPTLAAVYVTSKPEAAALFRKFFGYFLVLGLPIAVGTGIVSKPIIALIYGHAYEGSPMVLTVLSWGFFLSLFTLLQGWSIGAIHQERRAFFMPIIATVAYLVGAPLLISAFKERGLAVANLIPGLVTFVLYGVIIRSSLTPRQFEPALVGKVLLANAVMAGATLLVRSRPVFISIPVAAVAYGAMVVALKIVTREELATIAKIVRKRRRKSRPTPPVGQDVPPVSVAAPPPGLTG